MSEPRFPYVTIDVDESLADELSGLLFELGADGVEQRDATTFNKGTPGKVTLRASFETDEDAACAMSELAAYGPRLEEIVGDAWRDEWKKYFVPFEIAPGVVIRPPWETYAGDAPHVLELEPGRAFGTGLHETTSLVARALVDVAQEIQGKRLLDVGCGSGILSFIALKLGASHARAIDIDPEAPAVTMENAGRNALPDRVTADATDVANITDVYPLVLANIEAHVLIPMAPLLLPRVAPGGLLMLSGVLLPQKESVLAVYPDFVVERELVKGEWVALVLRRR